MRTGRRFRTRLAVVVSTAAAVLCGIAVPPAAATVETDTIVVRWSGAVLDAVRNSSLGPPMMARALAIVHTCIYDAWAAYDTVAAGTRYGGALRRPSPERTDANKPTAISYAAYRAAIDLFPGRKPQLDTFMISLGYDPALDPTDTTSPEGVGVTACAAVLAYRHGDASQPHRHAQPRGLLGLDRLPTGQPAHGRSQPDRPDHRDQPQQLAAPDLPGPDRHDRHSPVPRPALGPGPALRNALRLNPTVTHGTGNLRIHPVRRPGQRRAGPQRRAHDRQKAIAEYWADGPYSETPPGHWAGLFAQFVSRRDHHTIDQDATLFFAVANAVLNAGIAAWDDKRSFDSVRPITAIRYLFRGQRVSAWAGPGLGPRLIDGGTWKPYQATWFPTPPFPEFTSGHSTFSAAAEVLKSFTGSDTFGYAATIPACSSVVEPGITPRNDIGLTWSTFSAAADEARISRRYGAIHFEQGDLDGRTLGRLVGTQVWLKASRCFLGLLCP